MARKYTKVEELTEAIRARKASGETNREIGARYGLSKRQVAQLINRQNRKERKIAAGYIPRPKGRPRKESASEEENAAMRLYSCVCRWNYCEIFCAKLEGGEAEISSDRAFSRPVQHTSYVRGIRSVSQWLLCMAEPARKADKRSVADRPYRGMPEIV